MSTIQSNFALYSAMETVLRRAMAENKPVSTRQIHSNLEVQQVATHIGQVRDVISALKVHKVISTTLLNPKESFGDRAAYMWTEGAVLRLRGRSACKTPSQVQITKPAPINKELELVFGGVTIIIGLNKKTGRVCIQV
jgi:hypothetical protein